MSYTRSRLIDISVIAILAFSLGIALAHSLVKPPHAISKLASKSREPSSLVPLETRGQMASMNFPCSMNSKQTVNALQVRFNGVPCNATGVSNLALKNITNGYVATVFETNGGVFTTDLIQLAKGENKFEIAYDLPSGEPKVGTFSITNVNGN